MAAAIPPISTICCVCINPNGRIHREREQACGDAADERNAAQRARALVVYRFGAGFWSTENLPAKPALNRRILDLFRAKRAWFHKPDVPPRLLLPLLRVILVFQCFPDAEC